MSGTEFKQGSVICSKGDPLDHLLFITKGSAEASFNGRTFHFDQGDAIGLCSLSSGSHSYTYTATSDVTVFLYPYENFRTLQKILKENANVANLLVNSMCRQISDFLQYRSQLKQQADDAYNLINEVYPQYERLSTKFALGSKKLNGMAELIQASESDLIEDWVSEYYMEIKNLGSDVQKGFFRQPGISSGFLHKSAEDFVAVLQSCKFYKDYLEDISKIIINSEGHDLFALVSELHFSSINIRGADAVVESLMRRIAGTMSNMEFFDRELFKERFKSYKENVSAKRETQEIVDAPATSNIKQNLSDSLEVILGYSECSEEDCNKFRRLVYDYRSLPDKGSSDDTAYRLRKQLTEAFYIIYQSVFIKSLKDPAPTTIIKMFLNFGYVDAGLAGYENADYLYSIADTLKGDKDKGIYTICEWLNAIYKGEKEPCRNDFDEDYAAHINEMRISKRLDEKEVKRLLADQEGKLRFELESVFPTVNKITFGRVTTFCPVFSEYNVQRSLEASMVTPTAVMGYLDEIRNIDFSAYYREVLYSKPEIGIPKEYIHVEILPDIILMPNAGVRGVMWQEIEGRKRTTAARMFMPLFLMTDLKQLLMRLTGEFRWEMCKRTQGPRWTDITDPSLTSEMFDYLQFYRHNRELSAEVKASVKTELVRAKNTYKTVFVSNYLEWLMYEANGSPRLNKYARRILFSYCPFTAEIREKLSTNPQYTELLKRYDIKTQQRTLHLQRVVQKISQLNKQVPQELLDEQVYVEK